MANLRQSRLLIWYDRSSQSPTGRRALLAQARPYRSLTATSAFGEANRRYVAVNGMTAFELETVESCRSLDIVPADLFRSVRLVELRPACAATRHPDHPGTEARAAWHSPRERLARLALSSSSGHHRCSARIRCSRTLTVAARRSAPPYSPLLIHVGGFLLKSTIIQETLPTICSTRGALHHIVGSFCLPLKGRN